MGSATARPAGPVATETGAWVVVVDGFMANFLETTPPLYITFSQNVQVKTEHYAIYICC